MRPGWYWRPDIAGVMRAFENTGDDPENSALHRQGFVWVAVFTRLTGRSADWTYLHQDSKEARACEPITQTRALAELTGLGIATSVVRERGMLLDGEGFDDFDVPPLELAKQRVETWRADPHAQVWACVDFDYLKKSDRRGARQFQRPRDRPVQGWVLRRGAALIVAVRPDTGNFCVLAQEQFEGVCTAQKFVKVAARVNRVLGHNLLNSDYQAIGQVVEVSDELISKTIDIQDVLLRLEFTHRPRIRSSNGLGLAELLLLNTGRVRSKGAGPTTVRGMLIDTAPVRWKENPILDCQAAVALWSALVIGRKVVTGRSKPQALPLDQLAVAQLQGEIPCMAGPQWRAGRRGVPRPGHRAVGQHNAANLLIPALTTPIRDETLNRLRRIYARLKSHGLVRETETADLLTCAVQYLNPKLNAQLRTATGDDLCDELAEQYAVALWELTHRKEIEASIAIWQQGQEHPVPALLWPLVLECIDEHRAGVRRAARGADPAIPSHYLEAMHYFTEHLDTASIRRWLLRIPDDPSLAPWRQTSPAYRQLKDIPGYQQLREIWA